MEDAPELNPELDEFDDILFRGGAKDNPKQQQQNK